MSIKEGIAMQDGADAFSGEGAVVDDSNLGFGQAAVGEKFRHGEAKGFEGQGVFDEAG